MIRLTRLLQQTAPAPHGLQPLQRTAPAPHGRRVVAHGLQPNHSSSSTSSSSSSSSIQPSGVTGKNAESLVTVERRGRVALVTLNRPKALNALCKALLDDLSSVVVSLDQDESVGCVVLTGHGRAFSAGADILEMKDRCVADWLHEDILVGFDVVAQAKVPIIAAINGYAFGGGCELALSCDIMLCSDNAKFGQPEVKLGIIPGAGGTQRLIKAVGKSKAMELILTGRIIDAEEAYRTGLVSAVYPADQLLPAALKMAQEIANLSLPVIKLAKRAVNAAEENALQQGLKTEKQLFYSAFALDDQLEGMSAFASKRAPSFTHR